MEQKRIEWTNTVVGGLKELTNQDRLPLVIEVNAVSNNAIELLHEKDAEIERLQSELANECAAHAMTKQNFEDYTEEMQQSLDDKSQAEWNALSDNEKWRRIKNALLEG